MSEPQQPSKPVLLPELRKGLGVSFSDYDLDGKPQWLIHDAGRNKFFIIGWTEYEILSRWETRDAQKIVDQVNTETTLNVDLTDVESMEKFLARNFLFKNTGYQIHKAAKDQELFRNDNWFHWLVNYYLFFRIPLVHPDKFLVRTRAFADFLFSRFTFYIMCVLGVIAIYQISVQWEDFQHTFTTIINWQGFFLYMVVFVFCKLCHELGHAYMCRRYDVPVPTLGVAFLVFFPVLYTDTTLSWQLSSNKRLQIALAGMRVETYITIIAALIWANSHNATIQTVCYMVVAVNWVASVLVNVSPFMRFDGYYVLSDFLKMPNLQPRAFALTRWEMRKLLFGWNDPPPERCSPHLHHILVAYSVATWLYRFILYVGIALLVYNFFIKLVGILLLFVEIQYFLLAPFVAEFKVWHASKEKFSWNINTKITTTIAALIVIGFFLPIDQSIKLPATISYLHRFLISPEDGTLVNSLPQIGTKITTDEPIITVSSDSLNHDLKATYLEYNKSITELRRSSVDEKFSHQKNVLLSTINKEQAKYKKLHDQLDKLTLTVPFSGVVIDLAPDLRAGDIVMKNEWLGDVAMPGHTRVEAFAKQTDMNLLKKGLTGYFYPQDLSYPRVPVKVVYIEVLNSSELNCNFSQEVKQQTKTDQAADTPCYSASELGGEVATYSTEIGKYVPVESTYRVLLIPSGPVPLSQIQRGIVVLKTKPHSYAERMFYTIKRVLIEQSGF